MQQKSTNRGTGKFCTVVICGTEKNVIANEVGLFQSENRPIGRNITQHEMLVEIQKP